MFDDEEESGMRARYLMSPYNIREARRRIKNKSYAKGIALTIGVVSFILGLFLYLSAR